jgi:hypothetical protein
VISHVQGTYIHHTILLHNPSSILLLHFCAGQLTPNTHVRKREDVKVIFSISGNTVVIVSPQSENCQMVKDADVREQ